MRLARGIVLFGAASILTAACSLLTSVDGLTGGEVAEGGVASRTDAADAGMAETSTSGGDAGRWCATHRGDASICEDFDDNGLADWESIVEGAGGTTRPDPAAATSPPFAMFSNLPAAGGGKVEGYVARRVSIPAKSPFRLLLGAIYADTPHTGWAVRTDNVLLDAR